MLTRAKSSYVLDSRSFCTSFGSHRISLAAQLLHPTSVFPSSLHTSSSSRLPRPLTLPRQTPPPLQRIHTLRARPPLLLLLAIYPSERRSKTDRYREDGVEASASKLATVVLQWTIRATDLEMMCWYGMTAMAG
jgi:hypothetical protein